MHKRIRLAVAAAAVIGGFTVSQAGAVSAAHCFEDGSPGFSYFGEEGRVEERALARRINLQRQGQRCRPEPLGAGTRTALTAKPRT